MRTLIDKYLIWFKLAGVAVLACALIGIGWTAQGWRKDAEIAKLQADRANDSATQAKGALADLTTASKTINDAAARFAGQQTTLGSKLDAIQKEMKNAKPLPPDCRPDAFRLRSLEAAVSAANEAASR